MASVNGLNVCGSNPSHRDVFAAELAISREGKQAGMIILEVILVKTKDTLGLLLHDEDAAKFMVS